MKAVLESQLQEILRLAPIGISILRGPGFTYDFANPAYCRIIRREFSEIEGRGLFEVFPELAAQGVREVLEEVYRRGEPWSAEAMPRRLNLARDGRLQKRYFNVSYVPLPASPPAAAAILVYIGDATNLVEAQRQEQKLRDTETRYQLLSQATTDGIWQRDLVTGHVERSVGYRKLFGYSPEEMREDCSWWEERIHPEQRALTVQRLADAVARGESACTLEYRFRKGDGSYADVIDRSYMVFDEQNRPTRLVGAMHDVTSERRAAESVRQQQKWLEAVLDLMPTPLVLSEPETSLVTFANKAMDRLVGGRFPVGSSLSEANAFFQCVDSEGQSIADDQLPAARAARGESVADTLIDLQVARGKVSVLVQTARLPAMHGHGATTVIAAQDVTRLKRIEENLQEAIRYRDNFLATLSHELRTPMSVIVAWADYLHARRDCPAQTLNEGLNALRRNARAQAALIEDLLDVSRIVTGKLHFDAQLIDPLSIVRSVVESVQLGLKAKDLRLDLHLAANAGVIVGDPARLQQILWNLVSNAVKFTPRGGRIEILADGDDAQLRIVVRDNGEGMSPQYLQHAFDRFSQEDSSATRRHGGLGLGLAVVKHLVEAHGGTVRVASGGKGQGTEFTLTFPRGWASSAKSDASAAQAARERRESSAPLPASALAGVRVLLVDDSDDMRSVLRIYLEGAGAEVSLAPSARAAFEAFSSFRPDVLVSDIGMPDEDGLSLIRRVRALSKLPAIALTAYARAEERQQALDAGFDAHITKPVDAPQLIQAIRDWSRRAGAAGVAPVP